jgi:hypothetical protein
MKKLTFTLKQAKKTLFQIDPKWNTEDDGYKVALILLFGTMNNLCTIAELRNHLDVPYPLLKQTVKTIKQEGMWRQNVVKGKLDPEQKWIACVQDWTDENDGGVAFLIDVCRAQGYITAA